MNIATLVFLAFAAGVAGPDAAVPVEQEPNHKTVLKNDYVQVFRVTLAPGTSTGMHIHTHDDAAVRLSQASSTADVPGKPETAPDTKAAGVVSARDNETKPFTHRVHNVGATPYDVLDVQILKRPDGPAADAIRPPDAENPRMRVYRYELAPGAQSGSHTHARPYLLVAATPMNLRMTAPDGAAMAHAVKTGDLHWVEAPVTHTLVNDGPETGVLVEFELK
jgi:quercetin dioxygenase-like cupin family protein